MGVRADNRGTEGPGSILLSWENLNALFAALVHREQGSLALFYDNLHNFPFCIAS